MTSLKQPVGLTSSWHTISKSGYARGSEWVRDCPQIWLFLIPCVHISKPMGAMGMHASFTLLHFHNFLCLVPQKTRTLTILIASAAVSKSYSLVKINSRLEADVSVCECLCMCVYMCVCGVCVCLGVYMCVMTCYWRGMETTSSFS